MTTTEPTTRTDSHDDDRSSLPPDREHSHDPAGNSLAAPYGSPGHAGLVLLDVDALVADRHNQRRPLDAELVASVAAHGVLEPVLVIAEPEPPGAAAKLLDHPEELAELMDSDPRDVERAVRVALDRIDRQRRADKLAAQAEAAGWAVVDDEGYSPRTYRPLAGPGGLGLDAESHAGEPCHAVVIPARSTELVAVCTDARRHASRGASAVKAPATSGADADRTAERERRAAKRAADEQRRGFLDQLVAARVRKGDAVGLICWSLLDAANTAQATAACGLLGLDADQGAYSADWHSPLRRLADEGDAGLVRAALAVGLAQGDEAVRQDVTWHGRVDRFEAWLAAQGYEPSPFEVAQAAARRQRQDAAEGD